MDYIGRLDRVASAIVRYPRALRVLERLGVELPVGEVDFQSLALQRGVSLSAMLMLLNSTVHGRLVAGGGLSLGDVPLLVGYLLRSHDYFSDEACPAIQRELAEYGRGGSAGSGRQLGEFFEEYRREVALHFEYERDVAFPYMLQVAKGRGRDGEYSSAHYRRQHSGIEEKLDDVQQLLLRFLPSHPKPGLVRRIFLLINDLGHDTYIHTLIEDGVLTPLIAGEEARWGRG